ncbi:MAG: hypothetical protein GF346_09725 [Candidatus Eisenbacteria bacterium]|nr:hypothetical protein [Candidatus Latescibacterota bacterium]MBD3302712.1 hypothetical protein [Candidatus Eisenbacteria bacterium]
MPMKPILVRIVLIGMISLQAAPAVASSPAETADVCGECHRDIYTTWKASAHSRSLEDPTFLDAFRATEAREGDKTARLCLGCHAPMVTVNGDYALEQKTTWEGVSCDVCHSIVSVDLEGRPPGLELEIGSIKRGPIRDAESMHHEVVFSDLHTKSIACAGCHEYTNAEGTPLLTTYTEWKGSAAAQDGKTCQTCHMSLTAGNVVDPRVARVGEAEINLHEVPGGHSIQQLHKAFRVVIEPAREGDTLRVEVQIINRGAGHAVPTGMPGRRVILTVNARGYSGARFEEKRVYGKFFLDEEGDRIVHDSGYFAAGVRLESDSRIQPDETRVERFAFPIGAEVTTDLQVQLHYEHAPMGEEEPKTRLTFYSEKRFLKGSGG